MKDFTKRIYGLFNSPRFFLVILAFFIFESIWIALSATYPQAFDENFHFGVIQLYSHYWLPFLSSQPAHANAFGAVARDPSYLYHYLMSFPYRLINLFDHDQIGQVILLRFINVALLGTGIILFRQILRRAGISRALSNVILFLFVLIPVVPQLAAQINYDNLFIPLAAWVVLLTFDLTDQLRKRKPSIKTLGILLIVCLLTSLVKYAFLPIFLAVGVFLIILTIKVYGRKYMKIFSDLSESWKKQSWLVRVIVTTLLVISIGMFMQRDGINLIRYDTVVPDCAKVLNVNDCKAYSAWDYTYTSHQWVLAESASGKSISFMGPFAYAVEWVYWMWYRLFFAVNGPTSDFTNYPPLPLPSAAAVIIAIAGGIFLVKYWRKIFHNNIHLVLLALVSVIYIVTLFVQGYSAYHYTNVLQNMNGRYLLPVLLLLAAIFGKALSVALRNANPQKILVTTLIVILFLQGGGFLTFIARSDDTWDLQNSAIRKVNNTARRITDPVIVNGQKQYDTRIWLFN